MPEAVKKKCLGRAGTQASPAASPFLLTPGRTQSRVMLTLRVLHRGHPRL